MPNHTSNYLTITGPRDDLFRFRAHMLDRYRAERPDEAGNVPTDYPPFTLHGLRPMPAHVIRGNIGTGTYVKNDDGTLIDWWTAAQKHGLLKTAVSDRGEPVYDFNATVAALRAKGIEVKRRDIYVDAEGQTREREPGSVDWYDWRVANWGTKWDAYEVEELTNTPDVWRLFFYTAWSPPIEALEFAAPLWPTLRFHIRFADEGGMFLGEWDSTYGESEREWPNYDEGDDDDDRWESWYEDNITSYLLDLPEAMRATLDAATTVGQTVN